MLNEEVGYKSLTELISSEKSANFWTIRKVKMDLTSSVLSVITPISSSDNNYAMWEEMHHAESDTHKGLTRTLRHVSFYLGWPEWVLWWEIKKYKEHTLSKWTSWRTHNCSLPAPYIIIHRACKMENWWIKNCNSNNNKSTKKKKFKDKKTKVKPKPTI